MTIAVVCPAFDKVKVFEHYIDALGIQHWRSRKTGVDAIIGNLRFIAVSDEHSAKGLTLDGLIVLPMSDYELIGYVKACVKGY